MTRSDYAAPTFTDVPQSQWGSPPAGAVALDAVHLNAMAQAITNSAAFADVATGAVIHAAPTGNDGNDGKTPGAPKATVAAALAALPAGGGIIRLPENATFTMGASDTLTIDVSKVSVEGHATLHWTAAPTSGKAVQLITSSTFASRPNNWRTALRGVRITGNLNSSTAGIGLLIGGPGTASETDNFVLADGGVEGFTTNIQFGDNAWRIGFDNFHSRTAATALNAPSGLANFGECMTFTRCMIEGAVTISAGEFHFLCCSFDNAPITANGDCGVFITNSHLENPGATGQYRYVSITDPNALVSLASTEVIVNQPTSGPITTCLFQVADNCVNRGLLLTNVTLPQGGMYTPDVGDQLRALVLGGGRVVARGLGMNNSFQPYVIARGCNLLYNGDSEVGTIAGWTIAGSGNPALFTVDTTTKANGTSSFKLAPAAGTWLAVSQKVPCQPGAWVLATARLSVAFGAGSDDNIQVGFYAADGTKITGIGFTQYLSNTTGFATWFGGAPAPAGAVTASLELYVSSGTTATTVRLDDAILNII